MNTILISLTVEGPWLTGGLEASDPTVDVPRRRTRTGALLLPGSHLRGRLREALADLVATYLLDPRADPNRRADPKEAGLRALDHVARVFGGPGSREGGGAAWPSLVELVEVGDDVVPANTGELPPFDPASLDGNHQEPRSHDATQVRVAIDPTRGVAKDGSIGWLEAGQAADVATLKATLRWVGGNGLDEAQVKALLGAASSWVSHVGRAGSAGWGRVTGLTGLDAPDWDTLKGALDGLVAPASPGSRSAPKAYGDVELAEGRESFDVVFALHSPLIVPTGSRNNVFDGRMEVPGSVIRRAVADVLLVAAGRSRGGWVDEEVAQALAQAQERGLAKLAREFSSVGFGFAVPVDASGEARWPRPASGFKGSNTGEAVVDGLAAMASADGAGGPVVAPADEPVLDCPEVLRNRKGVRRELALHVGMDRFTGASRRGFLYGYRALATHDDHGRRQALRATVSAPQNLHEALKVALARVDALGKATHRGYGQVRPSGAETPPDDWEGRVNSWNTQRGLTGNVWEVPVMLRTEAILLARSEVSLGTPLLEAYGAAWREALGLGSESSLQVTAVMASHRLYGGQVAGGLALPPAILTLPGSVMLLRATTAEAKKSLRGNAAHLAELLGVADPFGPR